MTHIHIDMLGGLAGDMFLAAALDAGLVDQDALEEALSSLGVGSIRLVPEKVRRGAISGTHIHFDGWDAAEEADHRHLSTILEMLDQSGLSEPVKARASQMFETLGESESKVHDIPMERVHFHECGALDSIFDFVSAAFIIEQTQASWSASAVPTGSGTVQTDHGTVPVPVPATADILKGFELVPRGVNAELVTPTGATILKTLRQLNPDFERPTGKMSGVGYGAGTRELDEVSNVVRFVVLDAATTPGAPAAGAPAASRHSATQDIVTRLSCDIDDMNPEILAGVAQKLLDEGALDVVREPVLMKKARQGTRLTVLCADTRRDALAELLFRETTTFGVRVERIERLKLAREVVEVELPEGTVRVKVGYLDGEAIKARPEYEDCAHLAAESGTTVSEVYDAALATTLKKY